MDEEQYIKWFYSNFRKGYTSSIRIIDLSVNESVK